MKIVAVTDEHMNLMFQLVGIETYEINTPDKSKYIDQFNKIIDDNVGVIIITEQDLMRHRDYFKKLKMKNHPIIIEVPKLSGPLKEDYFEDFIKKYLGLTL